MEELQAALKNEGLVVANVEEKGRSLFTCKELYPGEVIISQQPYVCVASNSSNELRCCEGCFTLSNNLKKCSACQVVWYCGSTCQRLEWKLHRLECDALSKLDKDKRKLVTPSIRLMVKLLIRRKWQIAKIVPSTATDNYNLIQALVSHMKDLEEKQLVLYAQMANLIKLVLQWSDIDIKEIADGFSKLACNAHTICDSELRPLGTGLYPVVSIINHSCLPNAILVFEGRVAVVRAVQHIPKGSEVLISYIETAGSTMTRQKALKEQYFFTCTCPLCNKMESAILEGYRCKDDRCNGFLLCDSDDRGFVCQQCGLLRGKEDIKELAAEVKSSLKEASKSLSSGNLQETISIYNLIEKLQRKLCHPFSISLMQTREKLLKMLMELERWREAFSYCKMTIPMYRRVYPEFHPLVGLQYYTCGKLEWLLGDTEDAIKSLTKAVDVLRITHGTNTHFMKELIVKLGEARAEASYNCSSKNDK